MQYFSWAGVQIPLCFVQGVSYAKRARVIERWGGYVTSRGFEACEISAQVLVTRAACMAFGLDFDAQVSEMRKLGANKKNPSGGVTLGGYPIYPELQFALTNCNTTFTSDHVRGVSAYNMDITLSGVACTKEVSRNRALEFDPVTEIPAVTIRCNGKALAIQDGNQISDLKTSPVLCSLECVLGDDTQTASRKGFIVDVTNKGGVVEIGSGENSTTYDIIHAALVGNILTVSASVLPMKAFQSVSKTYQNADIGDIVRDLLNLCGVENASVKISGAVDYFKFSSAPWDAYCALQESTGFIDSVRGNKFTVAWLPESISAGYTLEGDISDDDAREPVGKVIWNDGEHEFEASKGEGGSFEVVRSCFCSGDESFASHLLDFKRYKSTFISLTGAIDNQIAQHSCVNVAKDGEEISCLVDFYEVDWVNGSTRYECRYLG